MTNTFKEIIGGTEKDVYKKFPWLQEAEFEDAVVDIRGNLLVWKGGVWKDGFWENGCWMGGTWENGIWYGGWWGGGEWKGGKWKKGKVWNSVLQKYEKVKQVEGKFKIIIK